MVLLRLRALLLGFCSGKLSRGFEWRKKKPAESKSSMRVFRDAKGEYVTDHYVSRSPCFRIWSRRYGDSDRSTDVTIRYIIRNCVIEHLEISRDERWVINIPAWTSILPFHRTALIVKGTDAILSGC